MSRLPRLDVVRQAPELERLRQEVRGFLDDEIAQGRIARRCDAWLTGWDEQFSRRLAERGWVGMTIPRRYGGQERSALHRHVVIEELLAAGAPVAAHWIADRQTAPALLKFGTEGQRAEFLPEIAAGRCFFAIGMSEPDSGSDLASVRTRAERVDGGWRLSGTKVWTSGAHRAQWFFVLARSAPPGEDRHTGLSQFIVDLRAEGVTTRPIRLLTGEHEFNEVHLDGVFVPDGHVLGEIGRGWHQVTAELGYERGGPERILTTFPLLAALVAELGAAPVRDADAVTEIGTLTARLLVLRRMSLAVAGLLAAGQPADVAAALVKDLGTRFEQEIADRARLFAAAPPDPDAPEGTPAAHLARAVLHSPGFTLRGGTNEVLRGLVAGALWRMGTTTGTAAGTDTERAIADAVGQIAGSLWSPERAAGQPAGLPSDIWTALAKAEFTLLPIPEANGGAGAGLAEAAVVLRELGRAGVPVPLAETALLAGWLLAAAGRGVPAEPLTAAAPHAMVAVRAAGGYRLTGPLERVPFGRAADRIVLLVQAPRPLVVVLRSADLAWQAGRNLAGEPRDSVVLQDVFVPDEDVGEVDPAISTAAFQTRGALARALLMSGAAEAAVDSAITYAGQRVQFGRPLLRFQAVQHHLAEMAAETVAATVAALSAVEDGEPDPLLVGAAKVQAGRAATVVARLAHQVHGAIGFTEEHPLRHATARLWAWRDEFGTERFWARVIGDAVLDNAARATDGLWALVTASGGAQEEGAQADG